MASTRGRQVVVPLANKSGGSVAAGDVVIIDTSNDTAFTTTTSARVEVTVGVAQETIANNATGRVLISGYAALVNVPASVTRGHYVETHTVAKQATGSSTRRSGSFGQFLTGGTTPTATLWGQTDQAAAAGTPTFVGVRVRHNASQSVTSGVELALALNTERYDTDAFHDTSTNNSRLTVPSGKNGKYAIFGTAQLSAAGGANGYLAIKLNGTTYLAAQSFPNQTTPYAAIATVYDLSVSDYVELVAFQDSGSSRNIVSTSAFTPEFGMHWLG